MRTLFLITTFGLIILANTNAQITKVMGKVIDSETKETLPFVTISFKGSEYFGKTTNTEGQYSIESKTAGDSIFATCVGYKRQARKVKRNTFQVIDFELQQEQTTLQELVVRPGENPAEILLKKIVKNRKNNDRESIEYFQYEAYNKLQIDANNVSEKFMNKRYFKPFKFVFENVDTSSVNGKSYLPIFFTESLSDIFYTNSPKSYREVIRATNVSGIDNKSITQFLGNKYQKFNLYDDFFSLFDKSFVSPIGSTAIFFYKYYLLDSMTVDNKWCYKIAFKPRHKQQFVFEGTMWINDTTFAIKKIEMNMAHDANVNFINDMTIMQEFKHFDNKYWMLSLDEMVVDFNITENNRSTTGFYAHKSTSYKNYTFNQPKEKGFYTSSVDIQADYNNLKKDESFWTTARHDSLTKDEQKIFSMVDSIKKVPLFRTYLDFIVMFTTGYWVHKYFEIGPYYTMVSFNKVEGARFRLGGRSSNKFSKVIMPEGYIAYGTKDETFKYGGGITYMFSKIPRRCFYLNYKNDVEQIGQSANAFREDNILASTLRRNPSDKLTLVKQLKTYYEHEWYQGFSNKLTIKNRIIYPLGSSNFTLLQTNETLKNIITTDVTMGMRFAYQERFVGGEFERLSLGTKYPIIELQYTYGFKDILNSNYEYSELQFNFSHWKNIRSFGWLEYTIEAGKTYGTLPYPLLKLHEGNETFSFDKLSFNLMNYYEFVSDQYVSLYFSHHFDGLFLNRIPLMRKLKWRELFYFKGVIGSLENKNLTYSLFPSTLKPFDNNGEYKPYMEAGIGVENIFKFLRVDLIKRLSYLKDPATNLNYPDVAKFGIMVTLNVAF